MAMRAAIRRQRLIGLSPAWGHSARVALAAAAATLLLAGLLPANAGPVLAAGTISLTGGPYTQDFNSLANVAGSTINTVSTVGWDLSESGDGARDNERYAVDTGESATADTYSYGSADSAERAFGGLSGDTLIPAIGASFTTPPERRSPRSRSRTPGSNGDWGRRTALTDSTSRSARPRRV
jgi:hypothetical protein